MRWRDIPAIDRFWMQVELTRDGCVRWVGAHHEKGYALFKVAGRTRRVHQWAYETFVGPIPEGKELDHTCRVRDCVNVFHLQPVTHSENVFRGDHWKRRITHCPAGHEYNEANTYHYQSGARQCRVCVRERRRAA